MLATVTVDSQVIKPKPNIRVLGLQIDTKLKWGTHMQKNPKEDAQPVYGLDQNIHLNLGRVIFQSKTSIQCGGTSSDDLWFSRVAYAKGSREVKRNRETGSHAEQMPPNG